MPHQQPLPSQSQTDSPSSLPQGGPFYPYLSDNLPSQLPMPQYPIPYRGYDERTPTHHPRHPMYYPNSMEAWNHTAYNRGGYGTNSKSNGDGYDEESDAAVAPPTPAIEKKGSTSNESDEEAAVTALLMAGGSRSENVETMKAAVRQRKQLMYQRNINQASSPGKSVEDDDVGTKCEPVDNLAVKSGTNQGSSLIIKDFPIILHRVLSQSEYAGTVLEWLSHGKSWRILRWDELSESVIPVYFPELCRKGGRDGAKASSSEKMNRFIEQINAWGFNEAKEIGPELGSFHHEVSVLWFRHFLHLQRKFRCVTH